MRSSAAILLIVITASICAGCWAWSRYDASIEPPLPVVEVRGAKPDSTAVWVDGHWMKDHAWKWFSGYWAEPPFTGAIYVQGHWIRHPDGWEWAPGSWIFRVL